MGNVEFLGCSSTFGFKMRQWYITLHSDMFSIFEKCRRHLSYIETPLLSSESHLMQLEGDSWWHPTEQHATREESSLGPGHDVGQSVIPILGHKDSGN